MLEKTLSGLDLNNDEIKIYLNLLESGTITAGNLSKKIGMPRATLYDVLKKMTDKGVINRTLKQGVRSFTAAAPEKLDQLFKKRIEDLEGQRNSYQKILPDLIGKMGLSMASPKFQVFEGVEGVQHVLKDMLMYRDCETLAFWPIKAMMEMLTPEFFRYHNKERIKNNLYTRAIWPEDEVVDVRKNPFLGMGKDFKREIRIAPTDVSFTMGYWAYRNKVAFLSSKAESYGFIIESQELVTMLKASFEVVWKISKKLEVDPKYTKPFIDEIK